MAKSYESDEQTETLLEQLIIDPASKEGYTLANGVMRLKGRLVVGNCTELKKKILRALHESPIGGHSGVQNTYHKVKQLFC